MSSLIRTYLASIDEPAPDALCFCGGCDWEGPFSSLEEIGDAMLTPGDESPAGRCPEKDCQSLAYVGLTAEQTLRRIFQALEAWAPVQHAIELLAVAVEDERINRIQSFCDLPGTGNAYDVATASDDDRALIETLDDALAAAAPWLDWQPGPVIDNYETTDETAPA